MLIYGILITVFTLITFLAKIGPCLTVTVVNSDVFEWDLNQISADSSEITIAVRNKVDCANECLRYSHCTSWAFQNSSNLCYIQVGYRVSIISESDIYVHLFIFVNCEIMISHCKHAKIYTRPSN